VIGIPQPQPFALALLDCINALLLSVASPSRVQDPDSIDGADGVRRVPSKVQRRSLEMSGIGTLSFPHHRLSCDSHRQQTPLLGLGEGFVSRARHKYINLVPPPRPSLLFFSHTVFAKKILKAQITPFPTSSIVPHSQNVC
jgi:hypothetical protein